MKNIIIQLKQRIDEDYITLQKKYFLTKFMLKIINDLINANSSDEEICQWLQKY